MSTAAVTRDQRFTPNHPCPICGGNYALPQGHGVRCHGFLSDDGRYAHCSRPEVAGELPEEDNGTYAHPLEGPCRCGSVHGEAPLRDAVRQNGHQRPRCTGTTRFPIRDDRGVVRAVHVRQDFADGSKKVHWEQVDGRSGLGGMKLAALPLYGVDDLANTKAVVVVEGEKARDALAMIGITAVGTVTGAKSVPSADSLSPLRRAKTVYLWPDNDDDGRNHMRRLHLALVEIGHRDVRVIAWPDAPAKGDAADFVATGGTAASVRRLIAEAISATDEGDGGTVHAQATAGNATVPRLDIVWMSDVTFKPIDWIWPRWLARGKLHLLGGLGGIGKGTITAAIAAQLSTGTGVLPDGTPAPLVRSLFLLSEDAPDDTLWPRLDIHGADMRNVAHLNAVVLPSNETGMLDLGKHLPQLEENILKHGIGLVVIDALSDFMPRSDRNSEGQVRDILTPLGQMAQRTGVAILGVMHPGKGNADLKGFQRLLGASAFGNVARCVWLAGEAPGDEGRMLLGVDKSNMATKPPTLEWSRAEDAPIIWHGPSAHSLDHVLGGTTARPRDDAEGFLNELLKGGSVASSQVEALGKAAGISWATLRRAADALGVVKYHPTGEKNPPWYWKLPNGLAVRAGVDAPPLDADELLTPLVLPLSNSSSRREPVQAALPSILGTDSRDPRRDGQDRSVVAGEHGGCTPEDERTD